MLYVIDIEWITELHRFITSELKPFFLLRRFARLPRIMLLKLVTKKRASYNEDRLPLSYPLRESLQQRGDLLKHTAILTGLMLLKVSSAWGQSVWVMDDGERIRQDDTTSRFKQGVDNPVWSPTQPVRLIGMRDEVVAFQVVIEAGPSNLKGVRVELDALYGPDANLITNSSAPYDPTSFQGRWIERFVEHYFLEEVVESGMQNGSLGGTGSGVMTGWVADALIPVEVAQTYDQAWLRYPLEVTANQNGVIWIDITIPNNQAPGLYTGELLVADVTSTLANITVELEVLDAGMPAFPSKTMLYYEKEHLTNIIGHGDPALGQQAEKHLWQLFHRHRISPMHQAKTLPEVEEKRLAFNGLLYTPAHGYQGPNENTGDNLLSLGTYGGYDYPEAEEIAEVESIADFLASEGFLPQVQVLVYTVDEVCDHPNTLAWVAAKANSNNPNMAHVLIGATCYQPIPTVTGVDLIMTTGYNYNVDQVTQAQAQGQHIWLTNGQGPWTGGFETDFATISMRTNGLIAARWNVERWFYWESIYYCVWAENETFVDVYRNPLTFWASHAGYYEMGDGVLVYPGNHPLFPAHSIGVGVGFPSIRLKNWRRGIQDGGYYLLAKVVDAQAANQIVDDLLVAVLDQVGDGSAEPAWSQKGSDHFQARRALADVMLRCTEGSSRPCPKSLGVCANSSQICHQASWSECHYGDDHQNQETRCDGLDNDCDGQTDEGCADPDGGQTTDVDGDQDSDGGEATDAGIQNPPTSSGCDCANQPAQFFSWHTLLMCLAVAARFLQRQQNQ